MSHTFHIPVLGLGYSVDTPLKVARYGISSVVSIGSVSCSTNVSSTVSAMGNVISSIITGLFAAFNKLYNNDRFGAYNAANFNCFSNE